MEIKKLRIYNMKIPTAIKTRFIIKKVRDGWTCYDKLHRTNITLSTSRKAIKKQEVMEGCLTRTLWFEKGYLSSEEYKKESEWRKFHKIRRRR